MSNDKTPFSISHDLEIIPPKKEKGYIIPKSDWDFLRSKIDRIHSGDLLYHTIGAISLGISGSAFIAWLTLPQEIAKICQTPFLLLIISGFTLFIGALSLFFAYQKRVLVASSKSDVLEEMDRLKNRYEEEKSRVEILLGKIKEFKSVHTSKQD
jgi:hypothetical protein